MVMIFRDWHTRYFCELLGRPHIPCTENPRLDHSCGWSREIPVEGVASVKCVFGAFREDWAGPAGAFSGFCLR
ncbi:hypothetical protein CULCOIPH002_06310 [Corynebacterium ulcerans]|nr:hypothetical protein CULCOIPH001_02390 [Corynebacterium ulcerans]GJJ35719.1 hypothetical protein CULCOIPH002_06310 [Corynebacterium ulcerans]